MAYIGKTPTIGNFQVCDAISVVNNQAAYTMQVGGVNVSPESANHMLVSLNGILQAPTSSFTVSGSTITFASNLVTGDVIDFIQILGNVLDLGVPSDNTVTTAKLSDSSVSLAKLTATGTKDATTFLRGDNTFAEAGGGAYKLLNTQSVTSSVGTVDFVNGANNVVLDSTYKRYRFICSNVRANSAANFGIRFRQGSSFISSNVYRMRARCFDDNNGNHDASNSTGMDYMRLFARAISNDAVETCMLDFTLNDLSNTSSYTSVFGTGGGNKGNGRAEIEMFAGMITNTTTVNGVQFVLSSGTFESGDFSLYGIEA